MRRYWEIELGIDKCHGKDSASVVHRISKGCVERVTGWGEAGGTLYMQAGIRLTNSIHGDRQDKPRRVK